jgi:hypothetical protein
LNFFDNVQDSPSTSSNDDSIDDASNQQEQDNSPIPDCDGIARDDWKGIAIDATYEHGGKFADVFVSSTNPTTSIDGESSLGDCSFGIVIHRVFDGDPGLRDTTISWPTHLLFFKGVSVYDHLRKHRAKVEE